jgi:hypothetical protein
MASIMADIGPSHVAGHKHLVGIVWVDGGVEHRAAAAWANYLEFARPERLAHHAECDCASCESFHLFSHAGFDGLNHCVDNRSITSMGSGQQNSTIEAEWKTFAWRHSLEQQLQNCEFDLKHPDSAGIPTEFVVPAQYSHGRFSAEKGSGRLGELGGPLPQLFILRSVAPMLLFQDFYLLFLRLVYYFPSIICAWTP